MTKPIRLTIESIRQIQKEFLAELNHLKMFAGEVNYHKTFAWQTDSAEKAALVFTPIAFAKMMTLLFSFQSEVAWHGVAERDAANPHRFLVSDILVYPQRVSGSSVEMDPTAYARWLQANDADPRFAQIRLQGHSHVDFSPNPSGVDIAHQKEILKQLTDDMFYIFLIYNKRMEYTAKIYDMLHNTLYETEDIHINLAETGVDLKAFLKEAKGAVQSIPAASQVNESCETFFDFLEPAGSQWQQRGAQSKPREKTHKKIKE